MSLINSKKIVVNCELNSEENVKFGGPKILGYDFIVENTYDNIKIREFINKCLRKYKRPVMDIKIHDNGMVDKFSIWNNDKIEREIKKGY